MLRSLRSVLQVGVRQPEHPKPMGDAQSVDGRLTCNQPV
jgi:hypothetical protein